MADNEQADRRAAARKQVRLLMARGEFAEARAERVLRSLSSEASAIRLDPNDQPMLDRHAFRSRTVLDVEQMLQSTLPDEVVLGEVFERFATRAVIASDVMIGLESSTVYALVGSELCRWVMTVAAELLHAIESACDRDVGCRGSVHIDYEAGRGLVMRVTAVGGARRPMPGVSGVEALERTGRLMRLFGSFDQSIEDGDLVYEAVFAGCTVNEVD
jgi:hypothetical protein